MSITIYPQAEKLVKTLEDNGIIIDYYIDRKGEVGIDIMGLSYVVWRDKVSLDSYSYFIKQMRTTDEAVELSSIEELTDTILNYNKSSSSNKSNKEEEVLVNDKGETKYDFDKAVEGKNLSQDAIDSLFELIEGGVITGDDD